MKYKLSDRLNAFLNDNVLPKFKGEVEQELLTWREDFDKETINLLIFSHRTTHGFAITVTVGQSDFVVVEPLKPRVWYPREKFDGNPNQWMLVERTMDDKGLDDFYFYEESGGDEPLYQLWDNTTHFMYIDKPNK